jgi:AraC family transcriptional regulator
MTTDEVKVVRLEPFRAASFHAYGNQPEDLAWEKLENWAKKKGYLEKSENHKIFGFNNPSPSPGSPNYGYEFWMVVGPDYEVEGDVSIKEFQGGLYAVLRWDGKGDPNETIPAFWKELVKWREKSPYSSGSHQWLEEHIRPQENIGVDFLLDLYLPISEA